MVKDIPNWSKLQASGYSTDVVNDMFNKIRENSNKQFIGKLEDSGYLEKYLMHFYTPKASEAHFISTIALINEKCKEGTFALFDELQSQHDKFQHFIGDIFSYDIKTKDSDIKSLYILFLIHMTRHLEIESVRTSILKYFSLKLWIHLGKVRLSDELEKFPTLNKYWSKIRSEVTAKISEPLKTVDENESPQTQKKSGGGGGGGRGRKRKIESSSQDDTAVAAIEVEKLVVDVSNVEVSWFMNLLTIFLDTIEIHIPQYIQSAEFSQVQLLSHIKFCEYFVEWLQDLLSQLSTRRFLNTLLDDQHLILRCKQSILYQASTEYKTTLFCRFVDMVEMSSFFDINDQTGQPLSSNDIVLIQSTRIQRLQSIAYQHYSPLLNDMIFSSMGNLLKKEFLLKQLLLLTYTQLQHFALQLGYVSESLLERLSSLYSEPLEQELHVTSFLHQVFIYKISYRSHQLHQMNELSLYPTETLLWDPTSVPRSQSYQRENTCAIPKLNIQFLSIYDYLLRNFTLYRLESTYEIREDIIDAVKRMGPRQGVKQVSGFIPTVFSGWARMALPIASPLTIDEVAQPHIGEKIPSFVKCSFEIDLSRYVGDIRQEWEALRSHDIIFLVCIEKPSTEASSSLSTFESERKELEKGRKPKKLRDFQWQEESLDFPLRYGIKSVRGCEIFEVRDEDDIVLNDPMRPDERVNRKGNKRKLRCYLDAAQYYQDVLDGTTSTYDIMNLVIRRKAEENNFKSILETIRDLLNTPAIHDQQGTSLPTWLQDMILGYGNIQAANYKYLKSQQGNYKETYNYMDTFLDKNHIESSFPHAVIQYEDTDEVSPSSSSPLYSLTFQSITATTTTTTANLYDMNPTATITTPVKGSKKVKSKSISKSPSTTTTTTTTTTHNISSSTSTDNINTSNTTKNEVISVRRTPKEVAGPYPTDIPPTNPIRFTARQVEAIRSGMNEGLTMIVGPPGTGKTDVAVQIISNLYHNFPTQKILLVTHSNAALNDLFEKIMQRNIDPRHLLRLGSGEAELREILALGGAGGSGRGQGEIFNKQGRVQWSLERRMTLLDQVQKLGQSLGVPGDVGYTCETAEYFYLQIKGLINKFTVYLSTIKSSTTTTTSSSNSDYSTSAITTTTNEISKHFPFHLYFQDTPQPLFNNNLEHDIESSQGAIRHIEKMFEELNDYRAFEVLRNQNLRNDYLLTKQARIVAMTCTHAAMTRRKLLELNFKYDSLIMEEAAQILEIETLIPMLLQSPETIGTTSRLKRITLIGDHYQLPPVVKNLAYQKYANLDQSMFTRFIRLGVPTILLDQQGRARSEIAALYSWRYVSMISTDSNTESTSLSTKSSLNQGLRNLPDLMSHPTYQLANSGFAHTFQLIDVPEFQGKGEITPTPFFYQNIGEAEYVVAVYQFMRLLGYPADRISILTSYNGQKELIRNIVAQRCKSSIFGPPARITTVDKYQGQQNDYILLSLVRTESIGHFKDIRRLVVALSRARLGLYVFCRQELFQNYYELQPAFKQMIQKPTKLQLVIGEEYPGKRGVNQGIDPQQIHTIEDVTAMGVLVYQMVQQANRLTTTSSTTTTSAGTMSSDV